MEGETVNRLISVVDRTAAVARFKSVGSSQVNFSAGEPVGTVGLVRQLNKSDKPLTTEMPSTETSIDKSIMSSASRAMQRACCLHGSGNPLTAMYLSPTVSTCHRDRNKILVLHKSLFD